MQLFVVHNPKTGAMFVFDNHAAALRCKDDLRLSQDFLIGCPLFCDWKSGQAIRAKSKVEKEMKQLMIVSYIASAVFIVGVLGFVFWWPLANYIWHYWLG